MSTEYPRSICDLTSMNNRGGKFPFEVCLYHTEREDEKPQVVAKVHNREAAQALAKWYAANVYSVSVLVR